MSTIKGNPKKEKKPRSAAQLEATARLVKLNKERAADVSSQSSFDDNDNDENYNYHCDDDGAEGVEDVYTEPPELPLEPEPVEVVVVKPKRKRRVYK